MQLPLGKTPLHIYTPRGERAGTLLWMWTAFIRCGLDLRCHISELWRSVVEFEVWSGATLNSNKTNRSRRLWPRSVLQQSHIWRWTPLNPIVNEAASFGTAMNNAARPTLHFLMSSSSPRVSLCLHCPIICYSSDAFSQKSKALAYTISRHEFVLVPALRYIMNLDELSIVYVYVGL